MGRIANLFAYRLPIMITARLGSSPHFRLTLPMRSA